MERSSSKLVAISVFVLVQLLSVANGQSINTPCTTSMINSFTPCMNYITGSSSNGTSPTADCCSSLKDLMSASVDCGCLLVTASVPLPLNVNRTLALSLPRACKSTGVPVQCKASGSPLPAPGPVMFGPPPAPSAFSPQASKAAAMTPEPTPEAPAFPPADVEAPPTPAGIRPVLTPSDSSRSYTISSPVFMLIFVRFMAPRLY